MAFLLAAGSGLGGCSWSDANPIGWYRHLSGVDKNDVSDKGGRNELNLEAGGQQPYPNLGTVPSPPERAMSSVDLERLQQGLAADRKNAEYSDQEVRQGHQVPPLPGKAPPASAVLAQNSETAPGQPSTAAPPAASAQSAAAAPGQPAAAAPAHGTPAKGSAAPPQESPLTSPSVRSVPQGEMPTAAPPPPTGVQPAKQQAALPSRPGAPAKAAPPPAAPPLTAPPPAAPALTAPPAGTAPEPAVMRAPHRHGSSVTLEAAEIGFGADGKTLSAEDRRSLAAAAKLQQQGGGSLRVIAYGGSGYGANAAREELDSFGEALDRANVIAQALTKLGVPASRITVQAAPEQVAGGAAAGQAVVLLDY